MKLDHIAIAVNDFEKALEFYKSLLNVEPEIEKDEKRGIIVGIFKLENVRIEVMAPISENSEISNFIQKRGGGIHHFALKVKNIEKYKEKFKCITDIQEGITAKKVLFLDPKEYFKTLIELTED
ncbi:MAG: VOC family protein [candidate division WOR-3 bacterium]|nr:VOC family protein [candidate division WOR-3 bacterium]MCX7947385.1 VOC family protein [candidate division WOR-3 bacterium]MDW8150059.1 VOC family protein [candidate division WOR-3 bacterium]